MVEPKWFIKIDCNGWEDVNYMTTVLSTKNITVLPSFQDFTNQLTVRSFNQTNEGLRLIG